MRTLVKIAIFLSTGNLVSQSGLDLQQVSGYTVVAEKLTLSFHFSFQNGPPWFLLC